MSKSGRAIALAALPLPTTLTGIIMVASQLQETLVVYRAHNCFIIMYKDL